MEAQRIFIDNLPKSKRWWEYGPIIIALLAFGVSLVSLNSSRKEFIAAHRPYVYVSSRQIAKDGRPTMDTKTVLLCCLNAPAKIINQKGSYVVIKKKEDGEEEVSRTIPLKLASTANILYPSERTSSQITIPYDFAKEILANEPNAKLRRIVRIEYKELSSNRAYYFEGNWDYNRQYNVWEDKNMFGN